MMSPYDAVQYGPVGRTVGQMFPYLVGAQRYARKTGQDRYWRIVWRDPHANNTQALQRELFFMSKGDYLMTITELADLGYEVTGAILYTDTTSDSPLAR